MKRILVVLMILTMPMQVFNRLVAGNNTIIDNESQSAKALWHKDKLNLDQDFTMQFKIKMGSANLSDGVALAFRANASNESNLVGGHKGVIGILDIPNTLVLEFDGYRNTESNPKENSVYGNDSEVGPDKNHRGHIAIVETNAIQYRLDNLELCELTPTPDCIKHKAFVNLNENGNEFPLAGYIDELSVFNVTASWDAKTNTFSTEIYWDNVPGSVYKLSHQVDVEKVFGGETEVTWGFTSATGTNKFISSVEIYPEEYPHQVNMISKVIEENEDTKHIKITLSRSIDEESRPFDALVLNPNKDSIAEVRINNKVVSVDSNGKIDLSNFMTDSLEMDVVIKRVKGNDWSTLRYVYQTEEGMIEGAWKNEEVVIPPVPELPTIPPIRPEVPVKPVVPEVITKKVYSLVLTGKGSNDGKQSGSTSGSNGQSGNSYTNKGSYLDLDPSLLISFHAGDHGYFENKALSVNLGGKDLANAPYIESKNGYVFEGFYDGEGKLYDANDIESKDYFARYKKVSSSNKNLKTWAWWLLPVFVFAGLFYKKKKNNAGHSK